MLAVVDELTSGFSHDVYRCRKESEPQGFAGQRSVEPAQILDFIFPR
jgi:hypothetical protein